MNEIGDISDINNSNNLNSLNKQTEADIIKNINKTNETNGFKNSFPIDKIDKPRKLNKRGRTVNTAAGAVRANNSINNEAVNTINPINSINSVNTVKIKKSGNDKIKILNIGQILLALFLLIIVCVQMINLFSENAKRISGLNQSDKAAGSQNIQVGQNQNHNENKINNISGNLNINNMNDSADINSINQNNSGVAFILGENDGKLAIFSPDKTTVYQTYDVYIDTLPEYDRNLLTDGIKVTSSEQLHSLLEDYSS